LAVAESRLNLVLLEPKQKEKHDYEKGPTDCSGRPLVEVSGPSSRRTSEVKFLPAQLSIGPFQQSRFSTRKSVLEDLEKSAFLSRYSGRVLRVRQTLGARLPISTTFFARSGGRSIAIRGVRWLCCQRRTGLDCCRTRLSPLRDPRCNVARLLKKPIPSEPSFRPGLFWKNAAHEKFMSTPRSVLSRQEARLAPSPLWSVDTEVLQ
jgi:hypothetical protein